MMVEQTAGTGDYILEARTSWPKLSDGYKFNESLSICENGSTLSWDSTNGIVTMTGNVSDKCYVYFDLTSFLLTSTSSYETTSIYRRSLFLNDVSISDGIGQSFVYKVGDVLKYSKDSSCFNCNISIYDANSNLIMNLSPSCDGTEYVMTGNEVSIVSNYGGPSGGLCGGAVAGIVVE